jgi:hypothetical protein
MKQKDYNSLFESGKKYLLDFSEITNEILNKQLEFPAQDKPKTKEQLFYSFLDCAQNKRDMPNSIGDINELEKILYDFNPEKVNNNYTNWEILFDKIKKENTPPGRMVKSNNHNYWVIYCKSIISISRYLSRFKKIKDFYNYVNQFISNTPDTRIGLPLILQEELFGFGFALACDFLKENISPDFIKPDTHIKDIFINLNLSDARSTDFQIFRDVIKFSAIIKETPYTVDKLFWLIGSGNFYDSEVKIKTNKRKFINEMKSKFEMNK